MTILTLSKGTSSSSEISWPNAVSIPVPMSIRPVKTVTLPSRPIASHESSSSGITGFADGVADGAV